MAFKLLLVMLLGTKGGTGKTLTSRYLCHRYELAGVDVTLVDADQDVAQLRQYYPDAIPVFSSEIAGLMEVVHKATTPVVLVDLPGRGLDDLRKAQQEASIFSWLVRHRVEITLINVATPYRASMASVGQMLDQVEDTEAHKVVLLNENFGPYPTDWVLWYGDDELGIHESLSRKRLIAAHGVDLKIPRIRTSVPVLLDIDSENFGRAISSYDSWLKTAHQKQFLVTWLDAMDSALKPVEKWLGL